MRVLIVDDEPIARARLVRLIQKIDGALVAGEAGDGVEAKEQIRALRPDVVLLDIDMPRLDGLAVAEEQGAPPIIFTTAHARYALDAFEAQAYDYLLKPVSLERLQKALARVPSHAVGEKEPWRLVISEGTVKRFIDARQVECFVADRKYVAFRVGREELLSRESLDALETRLGPCGFMRVNRGALVRRGAVDAYDPSDGGSVVLRSGERVSISRRAAPAVRRALGL